MMQVSELIARFEAIKPRITKEVWDRVVGGVDIQTATHEQLTEIVARLMEETE
ncbi:hypothetical protein UM48_004707 [Salmonella enterica subsp. enterica]|nr:hypothetical protein [Salmonella enterica subsp. enterica]